MSTIEQIKSKLAAEVEASKQLSAAARARGDSWFTGAEAAQADRIRANVESLTHQLKAAEGRANYDAEIDRLGLFIAGDSLDGSGYKMGALGAPNLIPTLEDAYEIQQAAHEGKAFRKAIGLKASITTTTAPQAAVGTYDVNNVFAFLRDRPRVLDHIPVQPTSAPSVFYYRGTTAASAAAPVAEGADKPESSPVWTQAQATIRKVAHYTRANDEVIDDFPGFLQMLGQELIAGLIDAENDQLINGSGVAPALLGLLATSGILTRARGADTNLDAIEKSFTDLRTGTSFIEPDTIIMNPANYDTIRLAKDSQLRYLAGDPLRAFAIVGRAGGPHHEDRCQHRHRGQPEGGRDRVPSPASDRGDQPDGRDGRVHRQPNPDQGGGAARARCPTAHSRPQDHGAELAMRVRVAGNHQVNYAGTVYGPGESFEVEAVEPVKRFSGSAGLEASNELAVWLASGWVEEVATPKGQRKARA